MSESVHTAAIRYAIMSSPIGKLLIAAKEAGIVHVAFENHDFDRVLDGLEERVAGNDHFEFYWFTHTDRAMTKTNTRLPESAPRHPLAPFGKWVDDTLIGNGLHQVACSVAKTVPATIPAPTPNCTITQIHTGSARCVRS